MAYELNRERSLVLWKRKVCQRCHKIPALDLILNHLNSVYTSFSLHHHHHKQLLCQVKSLKPVPGNLKMVLATPSSFWSSQVLLSRRSELTVNVGRESPSVLSKYLFTILFVFLHRLILFVTLNCSLTPEILRWSNLLKPNSGLKTPFALSLMSGILPDLKSLLHCHKEDFLLAWCFIGIQVKLYSCLTN